MPRELLWTETLEPDEALKLSSQPRKALQMMCELEEVESRLYGLDCGSCGAPSCHALAEDIVRGFATEDACIYLLKDKVEAVRASMLSLQLESRDKGENK